MERTHRSRMKSFESLEWRRMLTVLTMAESRWFPEPGTLLGSVSSEEETIGELQLEIRLPDPTDVAIRVDGVTLDSESRPIITDSTANQLQGWQWVVRDETTWLYGRSPEVAGTVTIDMGTVDSTRVFAKAFLGKYIEQPDPSLPLVVSSIEHQGHQHVFGVLHATPITADQLPRQVEVLEATWTSVVSGDATVTIDDGDRHVLRTGAPEVVLEDFEGNALLEYASSNGNLTLFAHEDAAITAFELKSRGERFTGPPAEFIDANPFNVYRPEKLFFFESNGVTELNFGPVLQPGLTADQLRADLLFDGARLPRGSVPQLALSIDGESDLDAATTAYRHVLASAALTTTLPVPLRHQDFGSSIAVEFEYFNDGLTWGVPLRVSVNGEPRGYADRQEDCQVGQWCRAAKTLDSPPGASEHAISIEFDVPDTVLELRNLQLTSVPRNPLPPLRDVQPVEFRMLAGTSMAVSGGLGYGVTDWHLEDDGGNYITSFNGFVLPGPSDGDAESIYRRSSRTSTSEDSFPFVMRLGNGQDLHDDYSVDVESDQVSLYFGEAVDMRSCTVEDFSWDGPDFVLFEESPGRLTLTTEKPIPDRELTIRVREGRCLSVDGREILGDVPVDNAPPVLVDIPLRDGGWVSTESPYIQLTFDEPIYTSDVEVELRDSGGSDIEILPREFSRGQYFGLSLDGIAPGDYELAIRARAADQHGNLAEVDEQALTFTVSGDPPTAFNRFDMDLDGSVDINDLNWLTANRYYEISARLDLDGDGRISPADVDILMRQGLGLRYGDVDLDGDFDDDDLALLMASRMDDWVGYQWLAGDFNGDGRFNESDLVLAFGDGWVGEALEPMDAVRVEAQPRRFGAMRDEVVL